uniref:Membrane protein n=1 Tax=Jingmen tick virus TaxID=1172985 RepID=A0A7S9PR12_9FLAV|nr:membrane protein [Jingmen tick virus]
MKIHGFTRRAQLEIHRMYEMYDTYARDFRIDELIGKNAMGVFVSFFDRIGIAVDHKMLFLSVSLLCVGVALYFAVTISWIWRLIAGVVLISFEYQALGLVFIGLGLLRVVLPRKQTADASEGGNRTLNQLIWLVVVILTVSVVAHFMGHMNEVNIAISASVVAVLFLLMASSQARTHSSDFVKVLKVVLAIVGVIVVYTVLARTSENNLGRAKRAIFGIIKYSDWDDVMDSIELATIKKRFYEDHMHIYDNISPELRATSFDALRVTPDTTKRENIRFEHMGIAKPVEGNYAVVLLNTLSEHWGPTVSVPVGFWQDMYRAMSHMCLIIIIVMMALFTKMARLGRSCGVDGYVITVETKKGMCAETNTLQSSPTLLDYIKGLLSSEKWILIWFGETIVFVVYTSGANAIPSVLMCVLMVFIAMWIYDKTVMKEWMRSAESLGRRWKLFKDLYDMSPSGSGDPEGMCRLLVMFSFFLGMGFVSFVDGLLWYTTIRWFVCAAACFLFVTNRGKEGQVEFLIGVILVYKCYTPAAVWLTMWMFRHSTNRQNMVAKKGCPFFEPFRMDEVNEPINLNPG